jgi:hypothetical protein
MAALVNEKNPARMHAQKWNVSALSSRVYFYIFASGGKSMIKKMLFLK